LNPIFRSLLDRLGVDYKYFECDDDAAASEWVKCHNDGKEKKPTLDVKRTRSIPPDK
jgi:hypothetical protein